VSQIPEPGLWREVVKPLIKAIKASDLGFEDDIKSLDHADYHDALSTGAQKREAIDAHNKWGGMSQAKRDKHVSYYNAFVKVEFGGPQYTSYQKDPRLIQAPDLITKYVLGRWMLAVADVMKKHFAVDNESSYMCYTSGQTSESLGDWYDTVPMFYTSILEVDFSRWDASLGVEALQSEIDVNVALKCPAIVKQLMTTMLNTAGRTTSGLKYRRIGTRHSGDPNTSVGNSILNCCLNSYFFQHYLKRFKADRTLPAYRGLVQGDDVFIRYHASGWREEEIEGHYVNFTKALGLEPKVQHRPIGHPGSFCSHWFVRVKKGDRVRTVLYPKVGRALLRLGYAFETDVGYAKAAAHYKGYFRAKCLARLPVGEVVPGMRIMIEEGIKSDQYVELNSWTWRGEAIDTSLHKLPCVYSVCKETNEDLAAIYHLTFDEIETLFKSKPDDLLLALLGHE
jgi:hypothetical protein